RWPESCTTLFDSQIDQSEESACVLDFLHVACHCRAPLRCSNRCSSSCNDPMPDPSSPPLLHSMASTSVSAVENSRFRFGFSAYGAAQSHARLSDIASLSTAHWRGVRINWSMTNSVTAVATFLGLDASSGVSLA